MTRKADGEQPLRVQQDSVPDQAGFLEWRLDLVEIGQELCLGAPVSRDRNKDEERLQPRQPQVELSRQAEALRCSEGLAQETRATRVPGLLVERGGGSPTAPSSRA